jgi:hypothetical protein
MLAHENLPPSGWRQRLLRGAIEMLGRSTVAHRLNVPYALLDDWLEDSRAMPAWKLSMLLDLIEVENVGGTSAIHAG